MINLARLKELERAATAGPWHRIPANKAETPFVLAYGEGDSIASFEPCGPWVSGKQAVADLNLTAALRNAAPELIAQAERVEALEAENAALKSRCERMEKALREIAATDGQQPQNYYGDWVTYHNRVAAIARAALSSGETQ